MRLSTVLELVPSAGKDAPLQERTGMEAETAMLSSASRDVNLLPARRRAMLKVKRVYEPAKPSDGYRILVDRIWPRGVSKKKARVDLWIKEIAPSGALRRWFGHDPKRWTGFQQRYRRELQRMPQLTGQLRQLLRQHRTVTLIFSARDERHNQAVALRAFLQPRK
jgi:uncharacterized protein YeaO (DUF488 family)